jgi:hypothetical protein
MRAGSLKGRTQGSPRNGTAGSGPATRPGGELTERQVNEWLLAYTDDVALLRRWDFGLLERTRPGSSYARPEEPEN